MNRCAECAAGVVNTANMDGGNGNGAGQASVQPEAAPSPMEGAPETPWHVLAADAVLTKLGVRARPRSERGRGPGPRRTVRAQRHGRGSRGVALAGVRPAVPRSDADRAAGRRPGQSLSGQGARDRPPADRPHRVQRGARPASGGQGGQCGSGPAEDAGPQGARAPRRPPRGAARGRPGPRRHRLGGGRRRGACRRQAAARGHPGARRERPDRREPARGQGPRPGRSRGHPTR